MKTIGSILLDVELVTQKDIDQALELQKQTGQRLGEVLVSLGLVSDDDIRWALAEQLNLPYVNIRKDQIDIEVATLLPEKLARRYHVIPILKIDDELTVVVDDPLNTTIIKDIEAITKYRVKVSLGRTSDIMLAIDEIYGGTRNDIQVSQEAPPNFVSSWFSEEDIQNILNDPSGQALLHSVLERAISHNISRIYFQPGFKICHISYRINGVLQPQIELGKEWYSIAMFRLKISAGIELSTTSKAPQNKEISYWDSLLGNHVPDEEEHVRIAVSIFPVKAGESAVLRIINKSLQTLETFDHDMETSIASQQKEITDLGKLRTSLQYISSGAIFLTGSPYPDKIATLYTFLSGVDHLRKNVITFEAYTEYSTDKYSQIRYGTGDIAESFEKSSLKEPAEAFLSNEPLSVSQEGGIIDPAQRTLSSWLGTLTQQDADVILVDHIGSQIVLSQCMEFAAHHLLLGAFEFKHVFNVLAYCQDCELKPSVLASHVHAFIGQHTVHLLCQQCKKRDKTDFSKQFLEQLPAEFVKTQQKPIEMYVPGGCPVCHMTGYAGRAILFEVLPMMPWLKEMLMADALLSDIQKTAVEHGFSSLKNKGFDLLLGGQTSLEQILSIVT